MSSVTKIDPLYSYERYHVVLDDGFEWDVIYSLPTPESFNIEQHCILCAETIRDLRKQSGRWKPNVEEEGTNASADQRAA